MMCTRCGNNPGKFIRKTDQKDNDEIEVLCLDCCNPKELEKMFDNLNKERKIKDEVDKVFS